MITYTITLSTGETCHAHAEDAISARAIVAADLRVLGLRNVRIDAVIKTNEGAIKTWRPNSEIQS